MKMEKAMPAVRQGFTLIEMLVTIAVIAIVAAAVIIGIDPAKRIQDAQNSRARQDVRAVATAVESCLSYADPTTGAVNAVTDCDTGAELTSALGTPKGGPFARSIPSAITFLTTASSIICFYEVGATGTWWVYKTSTGQAVSAAAVPLCP